MVNNMHKKDKYFIRRMTEEEVKNIAIEWAAKEGWNPGLDDAHCFYTADPDGFLIGLIDNEPAACISAVAYNEGFGFIGFYIVKPEFRGKGYGIRIWDAAMAYLNTQDIGLDGVVAQQANYMKSGFRLAYRNIRFQGAAKKTEKQFSGIIQYPEAGLNEIVQYDNNLFPAPRAEFLECWIKQPESKTFTSVKEGKITGYCVIRKCRNGYKIGPLFADSPLIAEELFLSANSFADEGAPVFLDVPEINKAAVMLAEEYGMSKVFETARMYTKLKPVVNVDKVFGVTTFELG